LKRYQSSVNINIKEKKDEDKRRKDTYDKDKKANIRNKRPDKIDERKELKLVTCPYCGCKVSQKNKISKRIIISLNLENSVRTTEYKIHHAYCPKCKRELRPTIPNSLPNSKYSLDIFLMISFLSVGLNLTDRKISEFFFNFFGLSISPATVCNMRLKLKNYLGNEYNVLEEKICDSSVSHTDESGWKKKSKNEWIVAVSSLKEVVYKIMKKRNMANAKKLPAGKIHVSDGLPIYNESGEERQRCFAHLIRKIKNPQYPFREDKEKKEYEIFGRRVLKLLGRSMKLKRRSAKLKQKYENKLLIILTDKRWKDNKNITKVSNYMFKYSGEWFTFLKYRGVPYTNNQSERLLRQAVIKRKISQQFESDKHIDSYCMQLSLYKTAKMNNWNYKEYLHNVVSQKLAERI